MKIHLTYSVSYCKKMNQKTLSSFTSCFHCKNNFLTISTVPSASVPFPPHKQLCSHLDRNCDITHFPNEKY